MTDTGNIRVGISACLLGEAVRFDGGHKRDRYVTDVLGRFVTLVPVCPEVEVGMGTPRESLRLVRTDHGVRMLTRSGNDWTDRMTAWAARRAEELKAERLDGYILKNKSPSCGMERLKVYPEQGGMPARQGVGLFARALMEALPRLPVEEEGRLHDPDLRECFVTRVYCHHRWREVEADGTAGALVRFHSEHKLLLMAHDEVAMRELGRLVAHAGSKAADLGAVLTTYGDRLFDALSRPATVRRRTNVLQHIAGYLKRRLDDEDRQAVARLILEYHDGKVPFAVPATFIRHFIDKHDVEYIQHQTFLHPCPPEVLQHYA